MPPKKPTLSDVLKAVHDLNVGMGAELASTRLDLQALTAKVAELTAALLQKAPATTSTELLLASASAPKTDAGESFPPVSAYEMDLIKTNQKVDAIVAYRKRVKDLNGTWFGLAEAKSFIDHVTNWWKSGLPVFNPQFPIPLTDEQKQLCANEQKIDAIKSYRAYVATICGSMCGLKEAKDVVDAYFSKLAAA